MLKNFISTEHHPSLHRQDSIPFPLAPVEYNASYNKQHNINHINHPLQQALNNTHNHHCHPQQDISSEESEKDYCYGGYHPVQINEKFGQNKNYKIIRKLGWGHFSTVWLAYDSLTMKHVALKIVRADPNYSQAARDEIAILEKIKTTDPNHPGYEHLVTLLDSFTHHGPNGEHVVMVFQVLGENLVGVLNKFKSDSKVVKMTDFSKTLNGLPISIVKRVTKQLCLAMDYLHRDCGLIHTDIKPENVLIEIKDVEKFVDYLHQEDIEPNAELLAGLHQNYNTIKKSPIKSSMPLPSPLLPLTSSFTYNTVNPSNRPFKKTPSSTCSISYSETAPNHIYRPSISHSPTQVNVSASEAASDDEYESDEDLDDVSSLQDDYFQTLEFYKTTTNTTTPPGSSTSRRSTYDSAMHESEITEDQILPLINVKIADLGNACYSNHHFTNDIQTRQYRAPEILLGHEWGCSTDCWSIACLIFELITGDYLFDPKAGKSYSKNDDHIAQILELLQPDDKDLVEFNSRSKYAYGYFSEDLKTMKKIKNLKYWGLKDVLCQKYKLNDTIATEITEFLTPLLELDPSKRADLGTLSNHKWLSDVTDINGHSTVVLDRDALGSDPNTTIKGWAYTAKK